MNDVLKSIGLSRMIAVTIFASVASFMTCSSAASSELRGQLGLESRWFTQDMKSQNSLSLNPEWYQQFDNSDQMISIELFGRYDDVDSERTHADIRELKWSSVVKGNDISIGLGRVFWGVTESLHLVDVVNQSDFVESVDGEDKLGQPMIHVSRYNDWGTIDVFVLPYFRERTFSSPDGRLSGALAISSNALYESGAEQYHPDLALRFSQTYGDWDVGLGYFSGTNRSPKLMYATEGQSNPYLIPYYDQTWQVSLDAQATLGAWLWKLEVLNKQDSNDHYWASVGGFEYTFFGVSDSTADLGVLLEYQFDSRPESRSGLAQNDLFAGLRFTLNDIQDTQFLAGLVNDLDIDEKLLFLEADRRFGDAWRISIDARLFEGYGEQSGLGFLNRHDHITLSAEYHF